MYIDWLDLNQPLHFHIDDLLSHEECEAQILRAEKLGFELATINRPGGQVTNTDIRNNQRVIYDDGAQANWLFERIRHLVPPYENATAVGCNERFRIYRYSPGESFTAHYDGWFQRNERERSALTLLIYLNEGCEGGETAFLDLDVSIRPATGRALFFQHHLLHEGCPVRSGVKYVLRTDVMYRWPVKT